LKLGQTQNNTVRCMFVSLLIFYKHGQS
jgi:hypothetical protein